MKRLFLAVAKLWPVAAVVGTVSLPARWWPVKFPDCGSR
jgi:hypothetical protein